MTIALLAVGLPAAAAALVWIVSRLRQAARRRHRAAAMDKIVAQLDGLHAADKLGQFMEGCEVLAATMLAARRGREPAESELYYN